MKTLKKIGVGICLMIGLAACKKESKPALAPIIGKWGLTKVDIHAQTLNGSTVISESYGDTSITTHTYFQFNSDNTAVEALSSGFYGTTDFVSNYSAGNPGYSAGPYNYSISDNTLNLAFTGITLALYITPSPYTERIITLTANTLVLQRTYTVLPTTVTTTMYFTRAN